MIDSSTSGIKYEFFLIDLFKENIFYSRELDNADYENFICQEIEINIDQTNKLIKYAHRKNRSHKYAFGFIF